MSVIGSIPLTIKNLSVGLSYPLSTGIPFPRGILLDKQYLQVTENGSPIAAQFDNLCLWNDSSIKSVLVSFNANASKEYIINVHDTLQDVYTPNVTAATLSGDVYIVIDGVTYYAITYDDTVSVETEIEGPIRTVTKITGKFTSSTETSPYDGELDYLIRIYAYKDQTFNTYEVTIIDTRDVTIDSFGSDTPYGIIASEYGYTFPFSGTNYIFGGDGISTYSGEITDTHYLYQFGQVTFTGLTIYYNPTDYPQYYKGTLNNGDTVTFYRDGESTGVTAIYDSSAYYPTLTNISDSTFSYQSNDILYKDADNYSRIDIYGINISRKEFSYSGVGTGDRAPGWMCSYDDDDNAMTVIFEDFWQQLPKKLDITSTTMGIRFHPVEYISEGWHDDDTLRRSRYFTNSQSGFAKTYRFLIDYTTYSLDRIRSLNETYQSNVRAQASARWYCESGLFGNLMPAGTKDGEPGYGLDTSVINDTYNRSFEAAKTDPEALLTGVCYYWKDYGDRMRSSSGPMFYNDTHVGSNVWAIEYVRHAGINLDKEEKWIWLWDIAYKHFMDIDVCHARRNGYWGGGWYPAGEVHALKHEQYEHMDRNMHTGHALLSGLPAAWLLRGDLRAKDVIDEIGEWWTYFVPLNFQPIQYIPHGAEAHRDFAWPLFCTNWLYRATGNVDYLEASASIVLHCLYWWKTPADTLYNGLYINHRWLNSIDMGPNDYTLGTGFMYCYIKADNRPEGNNGVNVWMMAPLLAEMIIFLRNDEYGLNSNHAEVWDMILQNLNYCVKNSFMSLSEGFEYAEGSNQPNGIDSCIIFVMINCLNYLSSTDVEHPEWYDTEETSWQDIITYVYEAKKIYTYSGSSDLGFYGYETFYPTDSWNLETRRVNGVSGKAYGEQVAFLSETPTSWVGWVDGNGDDTTIVGDSDYGKIYLGTTGIAVSPVVNIGNSGVMKIFKVNKELYGGSTAPVKIYIRGSSSSFLQTDSSPTWIRYAVPIYQTWEYAQVKIEAV